MNQTIHNHYHGISDHQYKNILSLLKQIQMTQAELLAQIQELEQKAQKNQAELLDVLAQLQAAISNAQNVDPSIVEAVGRLGAVLQATDDAVPDTTAPGAQG